MHIAYNGLQFANKMEGMIRYARCLFDDLLTIDNKNKYTLYTSHSYNPENHYTIKHFSHPQQIILEENFLTNKSNIDIFHTPYPINDIDTLILLKSAPISIVTIHDLISYKNIGNFLSEQLMSRRQQEMRLNAEWADSIIAISEYTKQDLIKTLNIPENKIHVVYQGSDKKFQVKKNIDTTTIKSKYHITNNFIFNIGNSYPHKNIKTLVLAYKELYESGQIRHQLVIAGKKYVPETYYEIKDIIKNHNLSNQIIYLDHIDDEDLVSIYNMADLFVFPSLYEGFGMPPLEAMACGTPVVASNETCIPEVLGDSALLIDATSVTALAKAIYDGINNQNLRDSLISKGFPKALSYKWTQTAQDTLKVYESVFEQYQNKQSKISSTMGIYLTKQIQFQIEYQNMSIRQFIIKKILRYFKSKIPLLQSFQWINQIGYWIFKNKSLRSRFLNN